MESNKIVDVIVSGIEDSTIDLRKFVDTAVVCMPRALLREQLQQWGVELPERSKVMARDIKEWLVSQSIDDILDYSYLGPVDDYKHAVSFDIDINVVPSISGIKAGKEVLVNGLFADLPCVKVNYDFTGSQHGIVNVDYYIQVGRNDLGITQINVQKWFGYDGSESEPMNFMIHYKEV